MCCYINLDMGTLCKLTSASAGPESFSTYHISS